ncbi:hypothetical protein XENTR_v10007699 [Xenopus tropicalis]|nr:hypothetical protein XENTR_v10007699 [Xenopus tropicalis]
MAKGKKSTVLRTSFRRRNNFVFRTNYFQTHQSLDSIGVDLAQNMSQVFMLVSEVVHFVGSAANRVLQSLVFVVNNLCKAAAVLVHIVLTLCNVLWLLGQPLVILFKLAVAKSEASASNNTRKITPTKNINDEKHPLPSITKGHTLTNPIEHRNVWPLGQPNGFHNVWQNTGWLNGTPISAKMM